jgi:NADH-quinone oxidoreductase subunit N
MSRKGFECEEIADLKGLNRRNPVLAAMLLLSMFSLTGIPPMAGFYAKLAVLQALIGAGQVAAAVAAVMFSLIGAFYYLRIVKMAYFDEPEGEAAPLNNGIITSGLMSLNGLLIIALGVLPGGLMALCVSVIQGSLKF